MSKGTSQNNVLIYKTRDHRIQIEVSLKKDTVWLSQAQMAELFERERSVITKHLNNIFKEKELPKKSNVQNLHISGSDKPVKFYSLDVIISIGYRVKSLRGTQFRIWATNTLRKHIVKGYTINEKRLSEKVDKFAELQKYLQTLKNIAKNETMSLGSAKALIELITSYSTGLELIDRADHEDVQMPPKLTTKKAVQINYEDAKADIDTLRVALGTSNLFGNERSSGFESALKTIFQTFGSQELYQSIEEKAANLLYMIIKNHPFTDGNKRIGAFAFLRFLDLNGLLYRADNSRFVEENAMVNLIAR